MSKRSIIVAPGDIRVRLSNFPIASITRRTHVDHKPILLSHWYYSIKFDFFPLKACRHILYFNGFIASSVCVLEPVSRKPRNFRTHFEWHNSLCIFKTKASRGTKLCDYLNFYALYNIWKYQLLRISEAEFYEWLFGSEKFLGLSRNGPQKIMEHADEIVWLKLRDFAGYVVINKFMMIINDMLFFFCEVVRHWVMNFHVYGDWQCLILAFPESSAKLLSTSWWHWMKQVRTPWWVVAFTQALFMCITESPIPNRENLRFTNENDYEFEIFS